MRRFVVHNIEPNGEVTLSGPEFRHFRTVLRGAAGTDIVLIDDQGRQAVARAVEVRRDHARFAVIEPISTAGDATTILIVGCAVPRGRRVDRLVEHLCELGVETFVPLDCRRSVVRPRDDRAARLQAIAQSARKQSGRARPFQLGGVMSVAAFADAHPRGWLLHPDAAGARPVAQVLAASPRPARLSMLVGPEGGFTDDEREQALSAGFTPVRLAGATLRIETAASAATALALHAHWGAGGRCATHLIRT